MLGHHVHDAHHAVLVDDAHLGGDAVGAALVDGDIVIGAHHRVVDDVAGDEVEAVGLGHDGGGVGVTLAHGAQLFAQGEHFLLEGDVAAVEVLVVVSEVEVGGDIRGHAVYGALHPPGAGQIDMLLIGVEGEQQYAGEHQEDGKDEPFAVAYEELQNFAHFALIELIDSVE